MHGYDLKGDKGRDKVTKIMIPKCFRSIQMTKGKGKRACS